MTDPEMVLVPPRPPGAAGCELCPVCARWKRVRKTVAGGLVSHIYRGGTCTGTGFVDTATYVIATAGPPQTSRTTVIGRNQAEIVANFDRRRGRDVRIYLEKPS